CGLCEKGKHQCAASHVALSSSFFARSRLHAERTPARWVCWVRRPAARRARRRGTDRPRRARGARPATRAWRPAEARRAPAPSPWAPAAAAGADLPRVRVALEGVARPEQARAGAALEEAMEGVPAQALEWEAAEVRVGS